MKITTQSGTTFDADWVLATKTRQGVNQLTMQLAGDTPLGAITGDIIGSEKITASEDERAYTVYEGYTLLASLIYSADRAAVRVTIERDDVA